MDKEYFRKYYQEHAEEKKRKRRERYAMKKSSGSMFVEADVEAENKITEETMNKAKSIAQDVFLKERLFVFNRKNNFPDELGVVVMDIPFFCKNLVIPTTSVDRNKSWVAVFTESLNEVCFVNCKGIRQYFQGEITDYPAHYLVPVNDARRYQGESFEKETS